MTPIRPKFSNPPLVERAVTVAFEKIGLTIGDYGLFWSLLRNEFPLSEAAAPIANEVEQFDGFRPVQGMIELIDAGTLPRALFRNSDKGELIQLQPDRFSFNWVKAGDEHSYPHSEAVLARFFELLERFVAFLKERNLPELVPTQCEITNVNFIPLKDVGNSFADFATVIRMADIESGANGLKLENQMAGAKYLITDDAGEHVGRVHCLGQPTLRTSNKEVVYRFDITARGAPIGSGVRGIRRFLDQAVSAVNGAFLANVTQSGRQFWGEIDG